MNYDVMLLAAFICFVTIYFKTILQFLHVCFVTFYFETILHFLQLLIKTICWFWIVTWIIVISLG